LRIQLLGRFLISLDDRTVDPSAWRLKKAAGIVKLLALAPEFRLHREQLMESLWPEAAPKSAANNLRYSLFAARRILKLPADDTPYLQRDGDALVLGPADMVWTDVVAFERTVAVAWADSAADHYEEAVGLYGGDLLPEDLYADWATDRRGALRISYLTLLARLAELYEERGDRARAIATLQRLLMAEPAQEPAHVQLMRLHALSGERKQALAQFEQLRTVLEKELAIQPDPLASALATAIRDGRFPAPTASAGETRPQAHGGRSSRLPAQARLLVGREREIAEVRQLLDTTRLLTLTGTGGIGKTRLAIAVAHEVAAAFPDGVAYVSLASLRSPTLVASALAQALELQEQGGTSPREMVRMHLCDRRLLLVIDNFEHLVEAAPELADLIESCSRIRMIVTSRTRLRLFGEQEYPVPPLLYPGAATEASPAVLPDFPATALFLRRAREVEPSFEATAGSAPVIAEICRRLHGLPLAIELAAARIKVLPPDALLARLDQPLAILTGGPRNAPERQQTMRDTVRWSYELLDAAERRLFQRLSVFAGGWTLEAAQAVVREPDDAPEYAVLDGLTSLVDKSLVFQSGQVSGDARFDMLEPVREFGLEQLNASRDASDTHASHARYFASLAEPTADLLEGDQPGAWLDRLELEHDNFRAALLWSAATELGICLAGSLWEFWGARGHLTEGRQWLQLVSGSVAGLESAARAEVLRGAGELARRQGDFEEAARLLDESHGLCRQLEDTRGVVLALNSLGILDVIRGDAGRARLNFERALSVSEHLGEERCVARSILNLGSTLCQQGEFVQGRKLLEEAVAIHRRTGNRQGMALALANLSIRAYDDGDYEHARAWTEESLEHFRSLGDRQRVAHLYSNLGEWALIEGDFVRAGQRFAESLRLARELGEKPQIAGRIRLLGQVALARSEADRAARLFGAAEVMRESVGWHAVSQGSRELYERAVDELRANLDAATLAEAWNDGRRLSLDEAIDDALAAVEHDGASGISSRSCA
jgi:predicted ATPase